MSLQIVISKTQFVFSPKQSNDNVTQQIDFEKKIESLQNKVNEFINKQSNEQIISQLQITLGELLNEKLLLELRTNILQTMNVTVNELQSRLSSELSNKEWINKISDEYSKSLNEENILMLYQQGLISLGRAAELCDLKYDKMIDRLLEKGIKPKFGPESIDEAIEEEKAFRAKMKRC